MFASGAGERAYMPMFHLSPFPPVSAVPIPHSGHMGEWYSSCKDSNRVAEQIFIDQLLRRRVFFRERGSEKEKERKRTEKEKTRLEQSGRGFLEELEAVI